MNQIRLINLTHISKTVYKSLDQVLNILTKPEVFRNEQVRRLLSIGCQKGILIEKDGNFLKASDSVKERKCQFVVIEGLDGSGKTTLVKAITRKVEMKLMSTPPPCTLPFRPFFDAQVESIKRAYYSFGNYLAASDVLAIEEPILMDRYWHSTAAYTFANQIKTSKGKDFQIDESDLDWPSDLLRPNLILFLALSEEERIRRHTFRLEQEKGSNTLEEQTLSSDSEFRQNIKKFYKGIRGPKLEEVNVEGTYEENERNTLQCLEEHCPDLFKA